MIFLILFFISVNLFAKPSMLATTTNLAWVMKKLAGDDVSVHSLLQGSEDPHYVDPMPHWIVKASRASVFCMVGLDLEIGWESRIRTRSRNAKIQSGGKGYCDAGLYVDALDILPNAVDRSRGDIHPKGNPHYDLGPRFMIQAAEGILSILIAENLDKATIYTGNFERFKKEVLKIKDDIDRFLLPVKKKKFISYHREFNYFFNDFGLKNTGGVEKTPGVPPSAGRIARVALRAKKTGASLLMASTNNPPGVLRRFSDISGIPFAIVPILIKSNGHPSTYRELLFSIARALVEKSK